MAFESEEINTRDHHLVGTRWPIVGSKGDAYEVVMWDRGWECSCPAFRKCKHIKGVEAGLLGDGI